MSESSDEEVVKPDRIGTMDPSIINWRAPSPETKRVGQRIFQIQKWIEIQGRLVHEEEIIRYAMQHFNVTRGTARTYVKKIIQEFNDRGVTILELEEVQHAINRGERALRSQSGHRVEFHTAAEDMEL